MSQDTLPKNVRGPLTDEHRESLKSSIADESIHIFQRADMVRTLEWDTALRAALADRDRWKAHFEARAKQSDHYLALLDAFERASGLTVDTPDQVFDYVTAALAKLKTAEEALEKVSTTRYSMLLAAEVRDEQDMRKIATKALAAIRSETTPLRKETGACAMCGALAEEQVVPPKTELDPDYDGAPWCMGCHARTQKQCKCGPIVDGN